MQENLAEYHPYELEAAPLHQGDAALWSMNGNAPNATVDAPGLRPESPLGAWAWISLVASGGKAATAKDYAELLRDEYDPEPALATLPSIRDALDETSVAQRRPKNLNATPRREPPDDRPP